MRQAITFHSSETLAAHELRAAKRNIQARLVGGLSYLDAVQMGKEPPPSFSSRGSAGGDLPAYQQTIFRIDAFRRSNEAVSFEHALGAYVVDCRLRRNLLYAGVSA